MTPKRGLGAVSKIQPLVAHFNDRPLNAHNREKLINIVLIPEIICMMDYVPPHSCLLTMIADDLADFSKPIGGLSSTMPGKRRCTLSGRLD